MLAPAEEPRPLARPRDPLAARIVESWLHRDAPTVRTDASRLVLPPSGRGVWLLANHRSYLDAHFVERALEAAGAFERTLWVAAGPKVQDGVRAVFASSLNVLPVPQPADVTGTSSLRALAREASRSIQTARLLVAGGAALLVFPEGTRTRTGAMGEWKRGVARYLTEGDWVVPVAIEGSEVLGGVVGGEERILPPRGGASVRVTFLPPVEVSGDAQRALLASREAVALHLERT